MSYFTHYYIYIIHMLYKYHIYMYHMIFGSYFHILYYCIYIYTYISIHICYMSNLHIVAELVSLTVWRSSARATSWSGDSNGFGGNNGSAGLGHWQPGEGVDVLQVFLFVHHLLDVFQMPPVKQLMALFG